MRFSVVIAAYQAADTVAEAIGSVLAQTRQDFEVIVVDDGSRDDTAKVAEAIAERDARVRVYRQANGGPSAARNRGISAGTGEYVSMLDSDDLWLPDYLEEMGRALDVDSDAGMAYTEAWELNALSGRFLKVPAMVRQRPPAETLPHERFLSELIQRNFVYNAVTVRRSVLEKVGGYDPAMTHGEDYELWLRIATSGFNAARVPGPLAIKRDSPSSLSEDQAAMAEGVRQAYRAVLERHPASPRIRAAAMARLDELREAEQRRSRGTGRAVQLLRRAVAGATRRPRLRLQQRAAPPPGVAQAFPGLGTGGRALGRRRR
ncbi:MAG TPA: glycosyltransferase family A protein [Solirubrobacteraceae bacterium]|jgi:GT2 family glycosyltransferase|nr:glycosyltransferase family A protein [Solirubrobacteraceae bacterium]